MNKPKFWIALERSKGIGYASLNKIYEDFKDLGLSIEDLFDLSPDEIKNEFSFSEQTVNGIAEAQKRLEEIEDDILDMTEAGIIPVLFFDSKYPESLKKTLGNQSPPILYCLGNTSLLNEPGAAILGHHEISPKGEMISFQSAKVLSEHSITVISGMSKGTGTTAHISAMENKGKTVAVLPCGMFFFKMTERLQSVFDPDRFLILSPFYLRENFTEYNAMNRNRLICALSKAVFIVESPVEGGIFEAVKSAEKLNKPVFTAEYGEYPPSASGNPIFIKDYSATPVRGRKEGNIVIPNLDMLLAKVKF